MLQTLRAKKLDEKWGHLSSFLPELWSLNCPKIAFLQFGTDLSKTSKSVKTIFIYGFESSHNILSENDIVDRDPSHCSWGISGWNSKNNANSAEIWQSYSTSNPNISKSVSYRTISNTIFWKCVTRPFACTYINRL